MKRQFEKTKINPAQESRIFLTNRIQLEESFDPSDYGFEFSYYFDMFTTYDDEGETYLLGSNGDWRLESTYYERFLLIIFFNFKVFAKPIPENADRDAIESEIEAILKDF